ncbi:MAG TPA: LysR family transcriptional regulator [Rhodanobacteraceae bacterium]
MPRQLPSLNALRAFEVAARHESISRAGDELHVTHGAISRQIRALEADLGVTLFVHDGRGVALTSAGRQLRDTCNDAFNLLDKGCVNVRQHARGTPLLLGCSSSVLARWIIPRLERLQAELPDITLHLTAMETPQAVNHTGVDAVLLIGEAPWPAGWQIHALASECIGPVMSPRFARQTNLMKADPTALCALALMHTTSRPQAWPAWFKAQCLPADTLQQGQAFAHLYYLLEAAVAGLGVAIAPHALVADDIAAGRLMAPWGFAATPGQWALCEPRASHGPRLDKLADWVRRELTLPKLPDHP